MQVPCPYCGVKLAALEEQVGMRGQCKACGHTFFIPEPGKLELRAQIQKERRRYAEYWAGKTDEEIAEALLSGNLPKIEYPEPNPISTEKTELIKKRQAEYWDTKSDVEIASVLLAPYDEAERTRPLFLPRYDDITLFTLAATFALLLLMSGQMRRELGAIILMKDDIGRVFLPLIYTGSLAIAAGMVMSIVNVFLIRDKAEFEKKLILIFAVLVTAGTGIYAAVKMVSEGANLFAIFAVWNFITGFVLIVYLLTGIADTEHITDEAADKKQIAISVIVISILLIFCDYVLKLHWVYTYSIAICYVTSLHNVVQDWTMKSKSQI